jgi:hypothetical protein
MRDWRGGCVYFCSTSYKSVRLGRGGQWRTCATRATSRSLCGLLVVCPSRVCVYYVPITLDYKAVRLGKPEVSVCIYYCSTY